MSNYGFLPLWAAQYPDAPAPVAEYVFAPPRKWRADFAWPGDLVAVEFDGGQWVASGGRHNRDSDREKLLEAGARGWIVLQFSNQQWEADPWRCMDYITRALDTRR